MTASPGASSPGPVESTKAGLGAFGDLLGIKENSSDDSSESVESAEDSEEILAEPGTSAEHSDDPTGYPAGSSEDTSGESDETDLLFAHIDALMDGSDAPDIETINLDDHPYDGDDDVTETAYPPGVEAYEAPADSTASTAGSPDYRPSDNRSVDPPVEHTDVTRHGDDYYQDSVDLNADTYAEAVAPDPDSAEKDALVAASDEYFNDSDGPTAEIPIPYTGSDETATDADAPIIELGFYGKLPTYGDFIQKRLPYDFTNTWHQWVQTGMLACRERDPEGWKAYYLNSPSWCFVLAGGLCGEQAVAGVTIPSVDRVGRYFNFSLVSVLPARTDPAVFVATRQRWYAGIEDLAHCALNQEMDQDTIDRSINEHSAELGWEPGAAPSIQDGDGHVHVFSNNSSGVGELLPALLHHRITQDHPGYGMWWHRGSPQTAAQLLVCDKMPVGDTYLSMIMDRDLLDSPQLETQDSAVDYMDELLSS